MERSKYLDARDAHAKEEAEYYVNNKSTTRDTAKHFGRSKSTIHTQLTHVIPEIDHNLATQVRAQLDENTEARALRGGLATAKAVAKAKAEMERMR